MNLNGSHHLQPDKQDALYHFPNHSMYHQNVYPQQCPMFLGHTKHASIIGPAHNPQVTVQNTYPTAHIHQATAHNTHSTALINQVLAHNTQAPAHNIQASAHNIQVSSVHNIQPTAPNAQIHNSQVHNTQLSVHNNQANTHNIQVTTLNTQPSIHNIQTANSQINTHNIQATAHNTQANINNSHITHNTASSTHDIQTTGHTESTAHNTQPSEQSKLDGIIQENVESVEPHVTETDNSKCSLKVNVKPESEKVSLKAEKKQKAVGKSKNSVDTSHFTIEERLIAAVWVHERKNIKKSMRQLKHDFHQRFGRKAPAKNTLLGWERKLFSTGCLEDAPRTGRPVKRRSRVEEVAASIRSAPSLSLRARALALRVPTTTLHTILRRDLALEQTTPSKPPGPTHTGKSPTKKNTKKAKPAKRKPEPPGDVFPDALALSSLC